MIGIQMQNGKGAAAICNESGPEILAAGSGMTDLVSRITARTGAACGSAVIAVPAHLNDEERKVILEEARQAGIAKPLLMNEPTAAALAYGASCAEMPKTALVLSLSDIGAFDATLVSFQGGTFEVLAANGVLNVNASAPAGPDALFAMLKPVIGRVLADGKMKAGDVSEIILTGNTAPLRAISRQIESAFMHTPVEPPSPETAVACGAAIYSRYLGSTAHLDRPSQPPSSGTGCLSVAALVIITALCLAASRL